MANNTLLASDNFASGSLAAGWAAAHSYSTCQVVGSGASAVTEPNATSTWAGQIWTGLTWPNDHSSEITLGTWTKEAGTYFALLVRTQSAALSGYQAQVNNATLQVYRYDAGTPTQLGSNVLSLTPATGDVWVMQAAGGFISVYQNGVRRFYQADPTYTSGSPGYAQYSSVAVAHSQVHSWRGYNAIQQDGIWQKQGVIIPLIASDLAASGDGIFDNSVILHEGNAQVLSGTVYKMWFSTASGIQYAESLDGLAWTRHSGSVLASYVTPGIIKSGSTYYMYCQLGSAAGSGDIALYTSSDGISWAQQSTTVLALGGVGTWDHAFLWSFNPIAIITGTWYALYSAGSDTTGYQFSVGLATSSDGVTWTKYASNPVIAKGYMGQAFVNTGGLWYAWVAPAQPGQGQLHPNEVPTEAMRYQSADLMNWSTAVKSIHHSDLYENLNGVFGQSYFNSIINIGGKAYGYTTVSLSDSSAPVFYQIGLAIAPAPIESVVQFNEDAAPQIATDAFTSGNGDLSANWSVPTGGTKMKIVAGPYAEPTATSTLCEEVYTGTSFSPNQYSEITIQTLTGTINQSYVIPTVRCSAAAISAYEAAIASPSGTSDAALTLQKRISGSVTTLSPAITITPSVGDVFRLQVVTGSDGFPILSIFQNGFLIWQAEDYANSLTSGSPGMSTFSSVAVGDAQIALWSGGNANVNPAYPSLPNSMMLMGVGS